MKRRKWLKIIGLALAGLVVLAVLVIIILALIGPAVGSTFSNVVSNAPPMEMAAEEPAAGEAAAWDSDDGHLVERAAVQVVQQRVIIRNGSISLVAEDTEAAVESITQMVESMADQGAFVVSVGMYQGGPYMADESSVYGEMTIRVPSERFDEVMDRLAEMAVRVTNRTESAQDVTEEYVDLSARLESLETARQRLMEIMQASQNTEALLRAEAQLTQRETEIESIKGRLQYLEQSARLSSITISITPYILSQPVDTRWRPAETAREALDALLNGLRGFADFLIYFTIAVLPWLALAGLVIYLVVRFIVSRVRRAQARRQAAAAMPDDLAES